MSSVYCSDDNRETLIFTCAGAAYSGQVANRAAGNLAQAGAGNLFCTAAVAAEVPEKLYRVENAGRRVVIDGCEESCARKVFDLAGIPVDLHLDITTLGVAKKPDKPAMIRDSRLVMDFVSQELACVADQQVHGQ